MSTVSRLYATAAHIQPVITMDVEVFRASHQVNALACSVFGTIDARMAMLKQNGMMAHQPFRRRWIAIIRAT